METSRIVQISLESWSAVVCLIAFVCMAWGITKEDISFHYIVMLAINTAFLLTFDVLAWIFQGSPDTLNYYLVRISNFGLFFCTYMANWLMFHYIIQLLKEKETRVRRWTIAFVDISTLFSIVMLVISGFTHLYYYFDSANVYHRTGFFWFSQLTGYLALPVFVIIVLQHFRQLTASELFTFLSFALLPGIALIVQTFVYGMSLLNLALTASVILVFIERMHGRAVRLSHTIDQLKQADEIKDTFVSNMSHELRTPLNGILGMNEMILAETAEPKTLRYAQEIEYSGQIMLSLVEDVLDYSMLRSGSVQLHEEPYVLSYLLCEAVDLLMPKMKSKHLNFNVQVGDFIPDNLIGDHHKIQRIILQLLTNAVKYSDSGTITLTLGYESTDESNGFLSIAIRDEGIGIKPEQQQQIFQVFERLTQNETSEGTGLGLAIAKAYADLLGGSISVESHYKKGSVFCLRVPQKIQPNPKLLLVSNIWKPDTAPEARTDIPDFQAKQSRILVVDDNKTNLKVLQLLLKRLNVHPELALSGPKALNLLKDRSYDLILLDQMMPEMDGTETFRKIREDHLADNVPVIAVTANAVDGARQHYLAQGFDDYISKPVRPEELERVLEHWLAS